VSSKEAVASADAPSVSECFYPDSLKIVSFAQLWGGGGE
jgi:hypothetical protein